jgi:hypothetical protein
MWERDRVSLFQPEAVFVKRMKGLNLSEAARTLALISHGRGTSADFTAAARLLSASRKSHGAGTGRPRTVIHNAELKTCPCVECRISRGTYTRTRRIPA